jgi:hypothetical protein
VLCDLLRKGFVGLDSDPVGDILQTGLVPRTLFPVAEEAKGMPARMAAYGSAFDDAEIRGYPP